jgi:type IX secretion system PorP/SprF family membrane protein
MIVLISDVLLKCQDAQFTQFYSVPLYLSPSFTGATQQQRFSGVYRQQWPALYGKYETFLCAYDYFFSRYNSGVGVMIYRDQAGTGKYGNTSVSLLYAYDFIVFNKSWHVRPGIGFVYSKYSLDFSKLKYPDQTSSDAGISIVIPPSSDQLKGSVDGTVSALGYNDKMWYGVTVDHLLRPNTSFYGDKILTPIKYSFFGGAKIISKGRLLKPVDESITVAFQYRTQADFHQLDLGLYWFKPPVVLGFWYRGIPKFSTLATTGDAVSILAGVKMYRFSFGYSYDFTISALLNSTKGAHEVSIIYEFFTKKRKKYHAIPCPEF